MRTALKIFVLLMATTLLAGCKGDPKAQRDKYYASGEKYLKDNRFEEATIEFRNALLIDNGHVPSYLGLARAFQQMGDHQSAIGALQQVVKLDGKNVEARLKLGDYMIATGLNNPDVFKQAQQMAEEILKLEPSNVDGHILLGTAYAGQNDIDNGIKEVEKALSLDPANLKALLNLGAAHQRKNDAQKAEAYFKEAIQKHPDSKQAHLSIATFYGAIRKMEEVENHLKKAFDLAPTDPVCLNMLASFYVAAKKPIEAENVFKEAIARNPDAKEPRWALAEYYRQLGGGEKGMNVLGELLKMKPGDRQVQLRLAELYLDQKNEAKAEEYVQAVLAGNKNDGEAHFLLGRILRRRQELDKALAEFEAAIKLNASLSLAYLEKANLLLLRGDLDNCQSTLEAVLQRNKNYLPARGALAKLLIIRQKPRDALQQAQEVLAAMPDNEDAIGARAEAFRSLGKLAEAKQDYSKLCELQPQTALYWHRLGTVEFMQGESAAAIAHFRKAVELKPDYVAGINDIVYFYLKGKQFDAALAEIDRLSKLPSAPQDEIHRFRGHVYLEKLDVSAAEREFRKAIDLNPQNYQSYVMLAQLNMQRNNLPQALKEIDQLIAKNNKLGPAFLIKGYYLQASKDVPGAMASYRKALELDPQNYIAANNLAWLICETDANLGEALSLARASRKNVSEDSSAAPEIADTLGWIYYKMKNYTLAVDQLLFSVNNRKQPGAEHYYRLGMAYYAKGDLTLAKQTLRRSLEINPAYPGADEARKILKSPG